MKHPPSLEPTGAVKQAHARQPVRKGGGARLLDAMARAFDEGRYGEAAAMYDQDAAAPPIEATFLRARLYLRARERHKAVSILNGLAPAKGTENWVWREMLLAEAYGASADFKAADAHLAFAVEAARRIGEAELLAAVGYRLGRRYALLTAQPKLAREGLLLARSGRTVESRLDALHLEAWILSREGRIRDEARVLIEILKTIDPAAPRHMEHRIRATQTLACIARESFLPDAIPAIERQLNGTPWPDDFRSALFQTTKALGWAKALQGDYFNAFRLLKSSAASAPDLGWRTVVLCDRAYLASVRGEHLWCAQELSDAEEAADAALWESIEDESPVALLLLAELVAPYDAARASGYRARFVSLGDIGDRRTLSRGDDRREALIEYCSGVVEAALGNRRLAVARWQTALKIYERVGYEWRAARCCLRLFETTRKRVFLEQAERFLRHYMSSWLAEQLRAAQNANPRSSGLSPMRERVFRLLCEGRSNVEIAAILNLKVATIANHAKAVLKAFGVSSRHALIAEAMRRGLVRAPVLASE